MNILKMGRRLPLTIRMRGPAATLYRALLLAKWRGEGRFEPVHPFDLQYGTDTSGKLMGRDSWVGSSSDSENVGYSSIGPSRLRKLLKLWQTTLHDERLEEFTFVDLGCGTGRALLLASEQPFRGVVGVELNPRLARTAVRNVELWKGLGKPQCPVQVVEGDVVNFAFPPGPCLVFLFNPFGAPIMQAVLDAIEQRMRNGESRLDVIYQTEGPGQIPLQQNRCLRLLWSGKISLSCVDAAFDPTAPRYDPGWMYRWVCQAHNL